MDPARPATRLPCLSFGPLTNSSRGLLAAGPDFEAPNSGLVTSLRGANAGTWSRQRRSRLQRLQASCGCPARLPGGLANRVGHFFQFGAARSQPKHLRTNFGGGEERHYSFSCNLIIASLGPRDPDLCFDVPLRFVVALARNISIPRETRCGLCIVHASVRKYSVCPM